MKLQEALGSTGRIQRAGSWREILTVFLKLGFTAFGGPIAHLGFFRDESS